MTEADWLSGKFPDDMLDAVADRVSPRRWRLLGAAYARKLWELMPPGVLRDAVAFAEQTDPVDPADAAGWRDRIAAAGDDLGDHARAAIRDQVRDVAAADTDPAAPPAYPSEVLHRAAAAFADRAANSAAEAAGYAAEAVGQLFAGGPPRAAVELLVESVRQADFLYAEARQNVVNAHKLTAEGNLFADEYHPKKARIDMSRAEEIVRRAEQGGADDAADRRERTYNRLLARFLFELVGNPFGGYPFDPKWRTGTVLDLARAIRDDRAFDRMPILADALLDADCDSEAVLRHCRGTEKHAADKPPHLRGCWVLDLILAPDDPLFAGGPAAPKRKPRDRW